MFRAQQVKRQEDLRLIRGRGVYTGDMRPAGMLHLVFARSPHAHALVRGIDIEAAKAAEGVVAVFSGADLAAAGLKPAPGGIGFNRPDGQPAPKTDRPSLAIDRVRCVGEAVVAVVATSAAAAADAVELVNIDYEPLPVVTSANARQEGAPLVWDIAPGNVAFRWQGGDADAVEAALQSAAHVTRLAMRVSRVAVNSMEPRNVLVLPQDGGRLLVHASHQSPFSLRAGLIDAGFEPGSVSVRLGDVGGSFGLKVGIMVEAVAVAHAARLLNRPVLWESTRAEAFLTDDQAREIEATTEIGFDGSHRIVGLRVKVDYQVGAYVSGKSGGLMNNMGGFAGVYDIPAIYGEIDGVFSNTAFLAAYRGAGRPEATYFLERALDVAARELGMSPFQLRRRNLIPSAAMPYRTALAFEYDCGEFETVMSKAERLADVAGFPARKAETVARGKLRGLGVCNSIEMAGGPYGVYAPDISRVALMADGRLRVQTGTMSVGQSFETVFPQLIADSFGLPLDTIDYHQGDTDELPWGRGNGGSSATCVGGPAVAAATQALSAKLLTAAAQLLQQPEDSVSLSDGLFRVAGGNRTLSLAELAAALDEVEQGVVLMGEGTFKPKAGTFPNGTHICEVEIDPATGAVEVVGYAAVEDIGTVINPMTAHGQVHGAIVQGIGQVVGEQILYDEDGQLLTGSYMDYQMPRAEDVVQFKLDFHQVPTSVNPLGAKGVGEAGTVGALSAAMNAVNDALGSLGIGHFDMPATPSRVWSAIQEAQARR